MFCKRVLCARRSGFFVICSLAFLAILEFERMGSAVRNKCEVLGFVAAILAISSFAGGKYFFGFTDMVHIGINYVYCVAKNYPAFTDWRAGWFY